MAIFTDEDLTIDENKIPPTEEELMFAARILAKLEDTKLITAAENACIPVMTNMLVALSDPENLHKYEIDRVRLTLEWGKNSFTVGNLIDPDSITAEDLA